MSTSMMKAMADVVGASEPAFRLLFSILIAYPMAWAYRCYVKNQNSCIQTSFLALCGVGIGLFNFGTDVYHSLIAVSFTYVSFKVFGPTRNTAVLNFLFHMIYLLVGYYSTETDTYDIKWTMPHCVLVLRLIGLSFDFWDGSKPIESLSASNKLTALQQEPSLLEISAHTFFPASFLVGPQFSMVRLKSFLNGKFQNEGQPSCLQAGCKRALTGLFYLFIFQTGTMYFSDEYLLSEEFFNASIFKKHIIMGIWGKIVLCKYVSCWLLTEGACISFGIAYNGKEKTGETVRWDGCRNIELKIYEGCTKFGHYIESFNINTNAWVAQYVYKRLIFLGNRHASQFFTLIFLAVWHGLHSGYYMTFFMEFSIMFMEKDLESIMNKSVLYSKLSANFVYKIVSFVVLKLYVTIFMGYCLIPFCLLNFAKWWQVYSSLYFSGFILFFPWAFVYKPIVRAIFRSKSKTL